MSDERRSIEVEGTHNPEQPPLHLEDRDHVARILDHVGNEERRQAERRVEVSADDTECPEEALHRQECRVDLCHSVSNLSNHHTAEYSRRDGR